MVIGRLWMLAADHHTVSGIASLHRPAMEPRRRAVLRQPVRRGFPCPGILPLGPAGIGLVNIPGFTTGLSDNRWVA